MRGGSGLSQCVFQGARAMNAWNELRIALVCKAVLMNVFDSRLMDSYRKWLSTVLLQALQEHLPFPAAFCWWSRRNFCVLYSSNCRWVSPRLCFASGGSAVQLWGAGTHCAAVPLCMPLQIEGMHAVKEELSESIWTWSVGWQQHGKKVSQAANKLRRLLVEEVRIQIDAHQAENRQGQCLVLPAPKFPALEQSPPQSRGHSPITGAQFR